MAKEFRRKPNRKSILRSDKSSRGEQEFSTKEVKSTRLFKSVDDHSKLVNAFGKVIGVHGNEWLVASKEQLYQTKGEIAPTWQCVVAGVVATENDDATVISIGDEVGIQVSDDSQQKPQIIEVYQRKTSLIRKVAGNRRDSQVVASNVDVALLVFSTAEPFYTKKGIDRYLISAEQGEVEPIIVINKIDLMPREFVEEDLLVYKDIGYSVVLTCTKSGEGLQQLTECIAGKTAMFTGPSGVGKSSIVNSLLGSEIQLVGEIAEFTQKGKHTTTGGRILSLGNQTLLIDTPGMREFGLSRVEVEQLPFFFREFSKFLPLCKFTPCSHTHEPNCAVKDAVESGEIDPERYDSYLKLREIIVEEEKRTF